MDDFIKLGIKTLISFFLLLFCITVLIKSCQLVQGGERVQDEAAKKAHLMSHSRVGQHHQKNNPGHKVIKKKK